MTRYRTLRYGVGFAIAHFIVIATLIPFEVICRTSSVGTLAFQIHQIIDGPVWDVPRLLSQLIASPSVTRIVLFLFPGPNFSPALIGLELAVFGAAGGILYFLVGIVVALLIERRRKHS
jgi:hypothetical protein